MEKCSIQYNSKIQSKPLQVERFSSFIIIRIERMKKNLAIAFLLIALTSTALADTACTYNDGCGLPVNQPIVVSTPTTISAPACATPTITPPVITPPTINVPTIGAPCINVPTLTPPSVIAPPTITPPTPVIPVVSPPTYVPPPLPTQVPAPGTIPTLPTPPVITLPTPPPSNCNPGSLSNQFTLTFTYVCRPNVAFQSCAGEVVWNNVIIASIVPSDYLFHTVTFTVYAQVGQNSLQFVGAGRSDSYGLLIDNVSLVRYGTSLNIVVNGDFSSPDVHGSWGIFNDISGWKGVGIEIGNGPNAYGIGSGQLCELDGNGNYQITQYFTFDTQYVLISNNIASCSNPFPGQSLQYTLSFDWAIRTAGFNNADSSKGNVLWNNVVVAILTYDGSVSSGVNHVSVPVILNSGDNILQFDGTSFSDSYGVSIDNVRLVSAYNTTNLVVNGGFDAPGYGTGWNYIDGGILGWSARRAEVGGCNNYNAAWPAGQCLELDSDSNQRYTQVISISNQLYSQLVLHIQQVTGTGQVVACTNLAINNGQNAISTELATINHAVQCQINMLANHFNSYLQQLYHCNNAFIQNVQSNQLVTISQYACGSNQWLQYFGQSGELDFSCDSFCEEDLSTGWCTIISINGKVINCHSAEGTHHLQLAPCSHFEGTDASHLPRYGDRIFWKGTQGSSGNIYVTVATTCDC